MSHELKIISSGNTTTHVKVLLDDKPIGLIQDVKFHASAEDFTDLQMELVFPDFITLERERGLGGQFLDQLRENIDKLSQLPYVKITLKKLEFDDKG